MRKPVAPFQKSTSALSVFFAFYSARTRAGARLEILFFAASFA